MTRGTISPFILLAVLAALPGCPDGDDRVAELAIQAADRQAAQNQELATLNREVAQATKQLVTSTGQARVEFVELQRDLQRQQSDVSQQLTNLETERRSIATTRMREPLIAAVLTGIASLLIACLPLALAAFLLGRHRNDTADPVALGELLIEEFASERPALLPWQPQAQPQLGINAPNEPESASSSTP